MLSFVKRFFSIKINNFMQKTKTFHVQCSCSPKTSHYQNKSKQQNKQNCRFQASMRKGNGIANFFVLQLENCDFVWCLLLLQFQTDFSMLVQVQRAWKDIKKTRIYGCSIAYPEDKFSLSRDLGIFRIEKMSRLMPETQNE